jgi:hypothetical protein
MTPRQSLALRLRLDARNALVGFSAAVSAENLVDAAEALEDVDAALREWWADKGSDRTATKPDGADVTLAERLGLDR